MMDQILITLAGLMGAAGVVFTAASAHGKPGAGLDSAGYMLLLHAAAVLGATAALQQGLIARTVGLLAAGGFVLGAALFSGDVALRAFAGHRLFPLAAPAGGVILIASWLALSLAALIVRMRAG